MTTPTTIYEAIKTDDYRGLLTLYATTVYDAVHSAEFAASLCGEIDVGMGGDGVFVDEKKFERHSIGSSSSKPSSIQQLDDAVRSILNPDIFSCRQQRFNSTMVDDAQDLKQDDIKRRSFKKIRQSPSNLLKKDSDKVKASSQREAHLERVMWESAAMLSNSHPPTNFVVERKERVRRDGLNRMKSEETSPNTSTNSGTNSNTGTNSATGNSSSESSPPLFEGSISNATPGTTDDGGTGSGTAQHLACLLDSPLALIILIVMGIDVDSRHTAFRRLAMHEAACADSPGCLELLMCMAGRYREEDWRGEGETNEVKMVESPRSGGSNKMKLPFFSWGENGVKGRFKKEDDMVCDADAESTTTFPEALKIGPLV